MSSSQDSESKSDSKSDSSNEQQNASPPPEDSSPSSGDGGRGNKSSPPDDNGGGGGGSSSSTSPPPKDSNPSPPPQSSQPPASSPPPQSSPSPPPPTPSASPPPTPSASPPPTPSASPPPTPSASPPPTPSASPPPTQSASPPPTPSASPPPQSSPPSSSNVSPLPYSPPPPKSSNSQYSPSLSGNSTSPPPSNYNAQAPSDNNNNTRSSSSSSNNNNNDNHNINNNNTTTLPSFGSSAGPPTQNSTTPPAPFSSPAVNSLPGNSNSRPSDPKQIAPLTNSISSSATPTLAHNTPISSGSSPRTHTGSSGESNSAPPSGSGSGSVVGVTVAGVFIIAMLAFVFVFMRRRRKKQEGYPPTMTGKPDGYYHGQHQSMEHSSYAQAPHSSNGTSFGSQGGNGYCASELESGVISSSKSSFTYEELMEITNGFSRENILGEGGFGCVYKGWLPDGRIVAVKQLKAGSGQGDREFQAEVEIISRVHHRHLASLVGYCVAAHHRLLIYEFVPNQTLEHHLHGKGMPVLEWAKRLKIALGAAKGLAYLHEDCHPRIIHRDIKSANILLDDVFEAQVADFGLARLTNDTSTHVSTRVMGTFGYLAPEYASSGKLTDRSDVFSFGVVLLELVTGRKPIDVTRPLGDESLVEWARPLLIRTLETGEFGELVDQRLEKHYVEAEMFRMIEAAAACVRHSAPKRPRMMQVVRALDIDSESSDLSNGVKFGQSVVYDSGQYDQDIMRFRRITFGSMDGSESEMFSGDFSSRAASEPHTWRRTEGLSGESESRAVHSGGGNGSRLI